MKTVAIAAVKTTQAGKSLHKGQLLPVLKGRRASDDKTITVFPGSVPSKLPEESFWEKKGFNYIDFAPQEACSRHQSLPHIRLDQVMQFLLGDKML